MKPRVGETYQERYLILAELGAGGMGTVYRARQIDANREVALKLLHSEKLEEKDSVARFYREFKLLSQLSHPNIMTLYGLALDDESVPFAICEYIEGTSLRSLLADGPLPWQRAVKISIQICHAMQYAHEQGILHRDLKPDNVLVTQTPEPDFVKLVDFGLSRALEAISDSQKLTTTGVLVGSPQYMSPEQITGKAVTQSDIYALACLMFELLSGQGLFEADSAAAVIYRQINESPSQRLKSLGNKLPPRLLQVLMKMLEKNPEQRYQSMAELAGELEAILENPQSKSTIIAASPGQAKALKIKITAISVVGLALAGALALALASKRQKASLPASIRSKAAPINSKAVAAANLVTESRRLSLKGKSDEAIDLLKQAIKSSKRKEVDPYWLYDVHTELAFQYEYRNELALSEKEWQTAMEIFPFAGSPKRLGAACGLAHILDRLGETQKAEQTYRHFILACEEAGNTASGAIVSALNDYVCFLIKQKKSQEAYKWAEKALRYSSRCPHGPTLQVVRDRATVEAVTSSWIFYDLSHDLGITAEGRRELNKTKSDLRSSAVRDEFTIRAIIQYATYARQRDSNDEAIEMYELAVKDSASLPPEDAKRLLNTCAPPLAELKKKAHLE